MFEQREERLIYGAAGSFERGHKCFSHLDKFLHIYYTSQLQIEIQGTDASWCTRLGPWGTHTLASPLHFFTVMNDRRANLNPCSQTLKLSWWGNVTTLCTVYLHEACHQHCRERERGREREASCLLFSRCVEELKTCSFLTFSPTCCDTNRLTVTWCIVNDTSGTRGKQGKWLSTKKSSRLL